MSTTCVERLRSGAYLANGWYVQRADYGWGIFRVLVAKVGGINRLVWFAVAGYRVVLAVAALISLLTVPQDRSTHRTGDNQWLTTWSS